MKFAALFGSVSIGNSEEPAPLLASAIINPSSPTGLPGSVTIDGTVSIAAMPRVGQRQVAGFRVLVDGDVVPANRLLGDIMVSLTCDNPIQSWQLGAALPSPFGSPLDSMGAEPGLRRIDILGVYLTSTGTHTVPLIANGIVDSADRQVAADGTRIVRYAGTDAGGRYDKKRITFVLPPGHGYPRDTVVTKMVNLAGSPAVASAGSNQMYHQVVLIDAEWLPDAKAILATENSIGYWNTDGVYSINPDGFDPTRPADMVLRDDQIYLAGALSVTSKEDVPTRVVMTGNAQVLKNLGKHTDIQVVEVSTIYAPKVCAFRQEAGGTMVGLGAAPPIAELRVTSRVETRREFDGDDLMSETVLTWGWYNPVSARYIQLSGAPNDVVQHVYILDPAASTGDNAQAFVWAQEKFVLVARQETTYTYDDNGFLAVTTVRKDYPKMAQADLKSRTSTTTDWGSAAVSNLRFLLAAGTGTVGLPSTDETGSASSGHEVVPSVVGIAPGAEKEILITSNKVLVMPDGTGFIQSTIADQYAYANTPGTLHLYSGGGVFAEASEQFQKTTSTITSYTLEGEASHTVTTTILTNGQVTSTTVQTGQAGALPAAPKRKDLMPAGSFYEDPTSADALARAASRFESQPIRAEWIDWPLEEGHPISEVTPTAQWAETPAELLAMAQHLTREGAASACKVVTPANFFVRQGMRITIDLPFPFLLDDAPIAFDLWTRQVVHRQASADGPVLTEIAGRVYLGR